MLSDRELRKKYMEILTKHIPIDCDINITELYDTVEKILSADCLFPLPEPLPKYMPITKKGRICDQNSRNDCLSYGTEWM